MSTVLEDIPQALAATAGPAGLIPVAFEGRCSSERLQDPVASLRRQVRNARAWLPAGCQIVAYYWDVESGGKDLEARGHSDAWQIAADAGIPRDGGIADLLAEAKAPVPKFAFVVCEDIERSARDTFSSLKLERALSDQGIPLFATDEPFNIAGINATTILVRRVKQGVAEWYRFQLREKVWAGLREHSLAGWNLGKVPTGYLPEKHPHPNPIKAAEGRTKTRLIPDPVFAPVVAQIYQWRVADRLGKPTIWRRLAEAPHRYPVPPSGAWSLALVDEILSNPKYTGHQVMGRRKTKGGTRQWTPATEWIWTPEPTHAALVNREMWDAAQQMGRRHGKARDPETPTTRPGRRYPLRSRLYCSICHRRMAGQGRTTAKGHLTYYRCPHDPGIPRHVTAYPDHRNVWVREEALMGAIAGFFTNRVFGPDRGAMLDATLPRTAAAQAARDTARAGTLRKKLAKIDVAETALVSELENTPEGMPEPAVAAYRQRLRSRFTELYTERTTLQTQLDTLETPADEPASDPALLDELPTLGDIVTNAPAALIERLLAIFDLSAVYNRDKHQLTIHATITDTTPQAIHDLYADPRADHNQQASDPRPTGHDQVSHLTRPTGSSPRTAPQAWAASQAWTSPMRFWARVRWPSWSSRRASTPGMCPASHWPWPNGTNLSSRPCSSSIGTEMSAASKVHPRVKARLSASRPSAPGAKPSCSE
jgi:DNA invertase Pin-like site-specific DNA recombinase